jgi:sec-independent protein translocase protein TatC
MEKQTKAPLLNHLSELRTRLIRIIAALVVATMVSMLFARRILVFLMLPYGAQLKVIGPTESVAVVLRVAAICGVGIALPYVLLQIWGYISPGLRANERRLAIFLIPSALALFIAGAAFAWYTLIPSAIHFLAGFYPEIFKTEWTSENYIPFVTTLLFWFGLSFELPLIAFLLSKLRLLSASLMLRGWRFAILAIMVLAALATPTVDPFNMLLFAAPIIVLYFVSILLAWLARFDRLGSGSRG